MKHPKDKRPRKPRNGLSRSGTRKIDKIQAGTWPPVSRRKTNE